MSNWKSTSHRPSLSHGVKNVGALSNGAFNGLPTATADDCGVGNLWKRFHEAKLEGLRKDALLEVRPSCYRRWLAKHVYVDTPAQETIARYEHLLRQFHDLSAKQQNGQADQVAEMQKQLQHMQDVMVPAPVTLSTRMQLTLARTEVPSF